MANNYIIDTNVLIIANDNASDISEKDLNLCKNFILTSYENSIFYIDSLNLIFEEYLRYSSLSGRPGIGDAFVKWLFDNQYNINKCKIVTITPSKNDNNHFEEFPLDDELRNFDMSDRKFVAVALSADKEPEICNGIDSDWFNFREHFTKLGIKIKFLCEDQLNIWEQQ